MQSFPSERYSFMYKHCMSSAAKQTLNTCQYGNPHVQKRFNMVELDVFCSGQSKVWTGAHMRNGRFPKFTDGSTYDIYSATLDLSEDCLTIDDSAGLAASDCNGIHPFVCMKSPDKG